MKIKSTTGPKELTYAVVTQVMLDLDDIYKFYEVSPSWAFKEFLKKNKKFINKLLYFFDKDNAWGQTLLDACNMYDLPSEVRYKIKKISEVFYEKT